MKRVRVEFDMTPEDAAAAAEVYATRDPVMVTARAKAQRAMTVLLFVLSAFLAFDFTFFPTRTAPMSVGCLIGAVIGLVLRFPTPGSWGRATRAQAATMLTTPAGKATLGPRSVEVGDDGIALASGVARTLVTWRGVINVIPTAEYQVVILPGPVCLAVPRRAFADDHDFERFGETVTDLATANGGLTGRAEPS